MTEIQVPIQLWDKIVSALLKCNIPDMNFGSQGVMMAEITSLAQKYREQSKPKDPEVVVEA